MRYLIILASLVLGLLLPASTLAQPEHIGTDITVEATGDLCGQVVLHLTPGEDEDRESGSYIISGNGIVNVLGEYVIGRQAITHGPIDLGYAGTYLLSWNAEPLGPSSCSE